MPDFERLFGLEECEMRRTCILLPWLSNGVLENFGVAQPYAGSSSKKRRGLLVGIQKKRISAALQRRYHAAQTLPDPLRGTLLSPQLTGGELPRD